LEICAMSEISENERKERRRQAYKLHLQNEHLIAIGHVAVRAAMLDKLIELTAKQITKKYSELVRKEIDKFSQAQNIYLIKEALSSDLPQFQNAISEFVSEIFATRTERNDVMHRIWRQSENPETMVLVEVSHSGPEKEVRRVSAKSMRALADRILDLAIELGDWKMCSNSANLNRSAARPGMHAPTIAPVIPPRSSPRDPKG
jgi:hypothetical protein